MTQNCPKCGQQNRDTSKFCASCGHQLLTPSSPGMHGQQVLQGRYLIVQKIGQGGFGEVYLAQDNRLANKRVAVKTNFDTSKEAQQQFRFEAHVLANLDHPNLPKVTDHFIDSGGKQYLVMEYVEGEDLDSILKRQGRLPEQQVLGWADALLDALHYLHTQSSPVIHRDVKPENIKLTPKGVVKLVDFGISKIHQPGKGTYTVIRNAGSPGFAPIEQYSGGSGTDARSDIFALGATLYFLLTGQVPPEASHLASGAALTPPRQLRPDLSAQTESVVMRAMQVNASQRFNTAMQMKQALHGQSVPSMGVSPPPQWPGTPAATPRPPVKKGGSHKLLIGGVLTAIMILLIAAGFIILQNRNSDDSDPTGTIMAGVVASPEPSDSATMEPTSLVTGDSTAGESPTSAETAVPTPVVEDGASEPGAAELPTEPPIVIDPESIRGLTVENVPSAQTGLQVYIRFQDGLPKTGSWVAVYEQQEDVSGNPTRGDRIDSQRTDDNGIVSFELAPGTYALELGDLNGGSWGNEFGYVVNARESTEVSLTLGRLLLGVRDFNEMPLEGKWTSAYLQVEDISGNPIKGDRVNSGRTGNTGTAHYDLVPGVYAVEIGDIHGELWGEEENHVVKAGEEHRVVVTLGRLTIGVKDVGGKPLPGHWVGIYFQELDLEGNPVKGKRIAAARTDDRGIAHWDITVGTYGVEIGDLIGDLWGEEMNHVIAAGSETPVILTLGRLVVGLSDPGGNPIEGQRVRVYRQEPDITGSPSQGERIADGRTDNRGIVSWDMTSGHYVVEVTDVNTLLDVTVEAGKTTTTNGLSFTIE